MSNYCLIKDRVNDADENGYGSVDYNFLISQNFISCNDYVNFLNSVSSVESKLNLYNEYIANIIDKENNIFKLKDSIDPLSPIHYINIENLKLYCNWINTTELSLITEFPYNLQSGSFNKSEAKYWIPNFDEWYKSVYYDNKNKKYWLFPNGKDIVKDRESKSNITSPYGIINGGFHYFNIIDNNHKDNYCIAGGAFNRHPLNAKSGNKYEVSSNYYGLNVSGRLCKKSETKNYTIKLYDTYGDGWGDNYIIVKDANHKPLTGRITLTNGYGPLVKRLKVDIIERNFNVQFYKNDTLSYENYYEIYDNKENLLFQSEPHEDPPLNHIVSLSNA